MGIFRWTLINNDTGARYVLDQDPKGWDSLALVHNRSERYDSIWSDFSIDIAFGCKGSGKEFVDEAYESKGSEGDVSITVEYACSPTEFKTLFNGKLNYSSYKQEFKDKKLYSVVNIEKTGISQLIKQRDETDVDLLSDTSIGGTSLIPYDYAPYDLTLHSRIIHIESEWEYENHNCCMRFVTTGLKELYILPEMSVITDDFATTSPLASRCEFDAVFNGFLEDASPIVNTVDNKVLTEQNTATITWNVAGQINFYYYDVSVPPSDPCDPSTCGTGAAKAAILIDQVDIRLRVFFGKDNAADVTEDCVGGSIGEDLYFVDLISLPTTVLASNPDTKAFSDSGTRDIIIAPGYKIYSYWVIDINAHDTGDLVMEFIYTSNELKIESNTTSSASTGKAIPIHEAWSRLCEGVSDKTLAFKSVFFGRTNSQGLSYAQNGYGSFTAILDGLRIRGFEQSTSPTLTDGQTKKGIITNIKDMYDSCNAVWGIGLGVEPLGNSEVVRVEEKAYFYQNVKILTLDAVPNMQMSFTSDRVYSEVEIGYRKWKVKEKGGLDEPNALARWIFPKIKTIKHKLELVSEYVAAMYAIEVTRRRGASKTEDTEYDDDIFFIALKRDVSQLNICEKNENFTSVTNLLSPSTAYNLRFNLFSNFDRTMNQFTTGLTKDIPHEINYSYLEGNAGMTFQLSDNNPGDLNGNSVDNVQDTQYAGNGGLHQRAEPYFLPEEYTFNYPLAFDDYLLILNNPYGYIEFSEGNAPYKKGYIKTLSYTLKTKMAEFALIRKFE